MEFLIEGGKRSGKPNSRPNLCSMCGHILGVLYDEICQDDEKHLRAIGMPMGFLDTVNRAMSNTVEPRKEAKAGHATSRIICP